jgi:glycosyltransferase involved in cell wall biosynthesis
MERGAPSCLQHRSPIINFTRNLWRPTLHASGPEWLSVAAYVYSLCPPPRQKSVMFDTEFDLVMQQRNDKLLLWEIWHVLKLSGLTVHYPSAGAIVYIVTGPTMKISVAMITYNQEAFIAQAIDSVLAQKANFDYELVIGEDCSTDGTRSIVMGVHRHHPERVRPLLREQNIGALRNFTQTLEACRGQYVAFLEGDDYWMSPDKLQKQVDFLDKHPDRAMCCHRVRLLGKTNAAEADVFPSLPAGPYALEDLLKLNFVMTGSMVLRRDLVPQLPSWFFGMKMGDWPLWAMVARHGKIELLDDVMSAYRIHEGGIWSSLPWPTRVRETARMLRAVNEHFGRAYTITVNATIAPLYLDLALSARCNGNRTETGKHLVACLRNGGWRLAVSRRLLAGLAAYVLIGTRYKIFSRALSRTTGG